MKDYSKVPVKVQKKSGFDKSFQNLFTSKVGTITPILCDELIPNTSVHLKAAISAALPPLASDTFMRCQLKYAAFFVPTRILVNGYEKWLTGENPDVMLPKLVIPSTIWSKDTGSTSVYFTLRKNLIGPGSLCDYLGYKISETTLKDAPSSASDDTFRDVRLNALPFLAYHKIYNDWFRNSLVQRDIYSDDGVTHAKLYSPANAPYVVPSSANGYQMYAVGKTANVAGSPYYNDGVMLTSLRQANFGYDFFTMASPRAQNGKAQAVTMTEVDGGQGFTISALRAANSMQQFLERNNLAGNRMVDYVRAQYGAHLSDSIAQRPILLGKGRFDLYSKGIYQTTPDDQNTSTSSRNPFNSVASRYGSAYADGQDTLIENFTAQEPGYLMVLAWLSPKVSYSTGIDPILTRYGSNSPSDMANPILQNVGNEPIRSTQLSDNLMFSYEYPDQQATVFGYQERYGNWKDKQDEVHGLLRDGSSLQSFALQRTFTGRPGTSGAIISTDFLQIPKDYLDQVSAVDGDISNYGYWADTYFDYKVAMPLSEYSLPSLQDPAEEHGETIMVNKSGTQIN
nr:MAG TPA: Major capsid protein [Microviridae sp.]